jgi:hypothetical protein
VAFIQHYHYRALSVNNISFKHLVLDIKRLCFDFYLVMKSNILLFVALGLVGVRVTQTQALTWKDSGKSGIRECAPVRRELDDKLSSQIGDQPTFSPLPRVAVESPTMEPEPVTRNQRLRAQRAFAKQYPDTPEGKHERAKMDKINERKREKRAFGKQYPDTPEGKRARANSDKRNERNRERAALTAKCPEEAKRKREMNAAHSARYYANIAKDPEKVKLRQAASKKRYADKKAAQRQAQTQTLVADPASLPTQQAAPLQHAVRNQVMHGSADSVGSSTQQAVSPGCDGWCDAWDLAEHHEVWPFESGE